MTQGVKPRAALQAALPPVSSTDACSCKRMNNGRTQNVLSLLCLLILYNSLLPSLSLSLSLSGVASLSQALCSSDEYSNSLLHLDLSKNPGVLSGEDASVREHTRTAPLCVPRLGLNAASLSCPLFAELVSLLVSAQLPGPSGRVGHRLLRGLSECQCSH